MDILTNQADLFEFCGVDNAADLRRTIHEQTGCDAIIQLEDTRITLRALVNSTETEVTTSLDYPFPYSEFFDALIWVEQVSEKVANKARDDTAARILAEIELDELD